MARSGKNKDQTTPDKEGPPVESTVDDAGPDTISDAAPATNPTVKDKPDSDIGENSLNENTSDTAAPVRSGVIGASVFLFGGVLAGAIGFLAAQYAGNDRWPFAADNSVTDELAQMIDGLEDSMVEQQSELQKLAIALASKSTSDDLDRLGENFQEINAVSDSLAADITALSGRLADVENRPIPEPGANQDAVDYYAQELAAMRAMLNEELAKIAARQEAVALDSAKAEKSAMSNTIQQSISNIQVAVQNGLPFADQLDQLRSAGVEIDPSLEEMGASGVPQIAELLNEFPQAARRALAASVEDTSPDSDTEKGVLAFFRNQLGVRSLEPKSGASVDAVLSRAEAGVHANDLTTALNELDALPDIAAAEMHHWIERATQRREALQLISALTPPEPE